MLALLEKSCVVRTRLENDEAAGLVDIFAAAALPLFLDVENAVEDDARLVVPVTDGPHDDDEDVAPVILL